MDRNLLLATTRAKFLQAFLVAVDQALQRTVARLFHAADAPHYPTHQRRLMAAYRLLKDREVELPSILARAMDQLLNRSFQTTYSTFRPSFFSSYAGNDLALVDAGQYEDQLHINEITTSFRHAAEEPLRDLNIRVAILFEQDTINERENPFRPFLFARALSIAIDSLGELAELNTTLFDQMAIEFAPCVAAIYHAVNTHLAENGVGAQLQLKIQKSASSAAIDPATPGDGNEPRSVVERQGGNERYAAADNGERSLSSDVPRGKFEQLFNLVMQSQPAQENRSGQSPGAPTPSPLGLAGSLQRLLFGISPMGSMPLPGRAPASGQLQQSLHTLMQQGATSVPAQGDGDGLRNMLFAHRGTLSAASSDADEKMTIDVVAMLFEFILRDGQIPAEVRAQLGRLQFLVLKIALRESALLTDRHHPARMLVNRIGSVSVGLGQLDPSGVRVSTEICRIVESLLADQSESSAPFATMLDEFDNFIALELRASDAKVDLAVQALENAQSRTLRFAHLTAQLAEALSGLTIAPFLHEFLTTTWVHVIERAERADGISATSTQFRQLVPELLWSILPKPIPVERAKLVGMLPALVGTLRRGLALESWESSRQQPLLDWLVDAHSNAMRSSDSEAPTLQLASLYRHFENFIAHPEQTLTQKGQAEPASSAEQEAFLAEALKESDVQVHMLDALIQDAESLPPAADATPPLVLDSEEQLMDRLRSGVAVEITLGSTPGVGRLNWINQQGSTLVLTMDKSDEPSMVSVRMFLRLLALGRVRFIESAPLFERAVQALLTSAEQVEQTR